MTTTTVTLNAIHLVDEGSYLVTRSHYHLEVGGIEVRANQFVVSDLDSIRLIRTLPAKIIHYVNEAGGIITVEGFDSQEKALLCNAGEDEYGIATFSDLDEEYLYKKFCRDWKAVYGEEQVEKIPVSVSVTEVRVESGDPDIKSLWNAPGMYRHSHLYTLDRDSYSVRTFREVCRKFHFVSCIPNHSGVRFATIDGKYIFKDDMNFKNQVFVGTLEQCKQEKERIHSFISAELNLFIAKRKGVELKNAGQVLNDLESILSCAQRVSPVKASRPSHTALIGNIQELIRDIRGQLLA